MLVDLNQAALKHGKDAFGPTKFTCNISKCVQSNLHMVDILLYNQMFMSTTGTRTKR